MRVDARFVRCAPPDHLLVRDAGWVVVLGEYDGALVSGTPFTPVVNGDINGDGFANDRAFIWSAGRLRQCVRAWRALDRRIVARAQLSRRTAGRIAARNSCEGPWTATMNAVTDPEPRTLGMQNRTQLSLSLTNVPGGARRARSWLVATTRLGTIGGVGSNAAARSRLRSERERVQVRGESAVWRYARLAAVAFAPFLITLEARVQLGAFHAQAVDQALAPGRTRPGDELPLQQLKIALRTGFSTCSRGASGEGLVERSRNDQLRALTAARPAQ